MGHRVYLTSLQPYVLTFSFFHFAQYDFPNMLNCKVYSDCCSVVHIALLCAVFYKMKKGWKIFVILFGGMKYSSYLCRRFSGARQFESKLSLRSLAKSLHHHLRLAEQTHRGPATGFLTTGARDKQIAAPVLSYHRQGLHFEHL